MEAANSLLSPSVWAIVLLLSTAGVFFIFAKYEAGNERLDEILERYPKMSRKRIEQGIDLFDRHGSIILLLTGIPGLDTVVALAAGASDVKKSTFIIWVAHAKTGLFWLLALLVTGAFSLLR